MSPDPEHRFKLLHHLYVEMSGRPWPWSTLALHRWVQLMVATKDVGEPLEKALVRVVVEIKRAAKELKGYEHHLKFMKITEPVVFLEHHAEAMARSRIPKVPYGLKEVLVATGRTPEPPTSEPVSAAVALERTKLAEELAAWRKANL